MQNLKEQFLLDPGIHFLNHGSFGATPKAVFDVYQQWQRTLENQPVLMLDRKFEERHQLARTALGEYIGCAPEDVVYVPNPTTAANIIAKSLKFEPGDEVLGTDHEYGAMDRLWNFLVRRNGISNIREPISLPVTSAEDVFETIWARVTNKTRVLFLSHISSGTALTFPIQPLITRAREAGIMTIIDGAHAPGQIPLNLSELGADFYIGACHKWLCAPKGTAFLYARKAVQGLLDPLVVSWGYESRLLGESQFIDYHELQGTRDISPFLSVPAAIKFQEENNWPAIQKQAHDMLVQARRDVTAITETQPICPEEGGWFHQMAAIQLPELDVVELKTRLYDEHRIEIPVYRWNEVPLIRISIQAYNEPEDIEALLEALRILIPELRAYAAY
jgi:isopenicillin-N epimerase